MDEEDAEVPPPPMQAPNQRPGRRRRLAFRGRREALRQPKGPTERDREEHDLSHIPPEDWCTICARTTCLAHGHRRVRAEDGLGEVPVISIDLSVSRRTHQPKNVLVAVTRGSRRGDTRACPGIMDPRWASLCMSV